jgi:L,D-transpeptidase ErfK/SrfK
VLGCLLFAPLVSAATFVLPEKGEVVGELATVVARHEDTLSDIARRYDVGYDQITRANPGVDPWLPREGTRVLLPTQFVLPSGPREGIVLNLPEMRLYYYPRPKRGQPRMVITLPVGIGREGWNTPVAKTLVVQKVANPSWYPPASIRAEHAAEGDPLPKVVGPGPDNPLGAFALYLGKRGYLIHGTDKPYGIGMRVSHGCMRLYPEDITSLYPQVPLKTPVYIVNQPYKAGWREGVLYVEVHPPLTEQENAPTINAELTPLVQTILMKVGQEQDAVDWNKVKQLASAPRGIPVPATRGATQALPAIAAEPRSEELPGPARPENQTEDNYPQDETPQVREHETPPMQAAPPTDRWFVQVGAFRQEDNAARLAAQLQHLTPPLPVQRSEQDGVYRVLAGPFAGRAAADRAARRITTSLAIETRLLAPTPVEEGDQKAP